MLVLTVYGGQVDMLAVFFSYVTLIAQYAYCPALLAGPLDDAPQTLRCSCYKERRRNMGIRFRQWRVGTRAGACPEWGWVCKRERLNENKMSY